MFSQVNKTNHLSRVLLSNRSLSIKKISKNSLVAVVVREYSRTLACSTLTNLPISDGSAKKTPESAHIEPGDAVSLDRSIKLSLLRKNLINRGLKAVKNRDRLVVDFFNLSKAVMDNKLSVETLVKTETFQQLEKELDYSIDVMGNSQIINLLASAIKMQINPSTNLVRLLEHEVKFRLKEFNLAQISKLLRFYNSSEISSEQKQVADMLSHQIRAYIQNETKSVEELNIVLNSIAAQQSSASLLSLVEEQLLGLLVNQTVDEDDIVSVYLPKSTSYDHRSLCNLFIELAKNKRRPTPLLKAASAAFCKLNPSKEKLKESNQELIISALNALVNLNYTNRALISRLISDLVEIIDLDKLDTNFVCILLRTLAKLRWQSVEVLEKLFSFIRENRNDLVKIDHNVVLTFLHVVAIVNFKVDGGIENFYSECMKGPREQMLDKKTRKWLTYVWSLATLNIENESHLRSVLTYDFYAAINQDSKSSGHYSDVMKLLNLRAIAEYGLQLDKLECNHLDHLAAQKIQRNVEINKFASKVEEALGADYCSEVNTPFGFTIDCELHVDDSYLVHRIDEEESFKKLDLSKLIFNRPIKPNLTKCALIYASYAETIANIQGEVYGHKQMISRILKIFDYKTIFLVEPILNREKTSADFSNKINMTIRDALTKATPD